MRLNKWIASQTTYSRRNADDLIMAGRVTLNGRTANLGDQAEPTDEIRIDTRLIRNKEIPKITILVNKPEGYVCSRKGQGAPTVYSLLPLKFHHLEIAGRLDKDSTGLVLMTSDREMLHTLTHPSSQKTKTYHVTLENALSEGYRQTIVREGITLDDGISKFDVEVLTEDRKQVEVTMHEGRNRQIRRTFDRMGNRVTALERTKIADYKLGGLGSGEFIVTK